MKKITELSVKCTGAMHITVKKCFDPYGGEQNFLAYTFDGDGVSLHGMLHDGSVSKRDGTNFLFFADQTMDDKDSVEMAGTVADTHLVAEHVDEAAGSLSEAENMIEYMHLM